MKVVEWFSFRRILKLGVFIVKAGGVARLFFSLKEFRKGVGLTTLNWKNIKCCLRDWEKVQSLLKNDLWMPV
jgi:hypothetical protein